MKYLIRGLMPTVYILVVELVVYLILFRNTKVALYAFLWTAIMIGALLLKITNVGPINNPLNVMNARQYTNLFIIKKLFPSKSKGSEVTSSDSIFEIVCYILVIMVNSLILYVYG
ncbi:hypothetical protein [Fusibacter sp. JL216-2]|uniref:hypothetical protein n=1 Tax=Fusibacter sp. JL216-2 TaxID=3071453 RepID=UPI003D329F80